MTMTSTVSPQAEEISSNQPTSMNLLFVGDLSHFCTEKDLAGVFMQFGPIISTQIRKGRSGDSLMHGFVELEEISQAQKAIEVLNDSKFMGRRMRVNWAYSTLPPREKDTWTQLHVSFVTRELNYMITEATLDSIFSPFGEIADICLKKHVRDKDTLVQSGYGFIYFFRPEGAVAARETIRKRLINGVTYDCSLSYRSEQDLKGKPVASRLEKKESGSPVGSIASETTETFHYQPPPTQPAVLQPTMQQFSHQMPIQYIPMQPLYHSYPMSYPLNTSTPQQQQYQNAGAGASSGPMPLPMQTPTHHSHLSHASHPPSPPPYPYMISPSMIPGSMFVPPPHAMFTPLPPMQHSPPSPYSTSPPHQQYVQQYMQQPMFSSGSNSPPPHHHSPMTYHMQHAQQPLPQQVPPDSNNYATSQFISTEMHMPVTSTVMVARPPLPNQNNQNNQNNLQYYVTIPTSQLRNHL